MPLRGIVPSFDPKEAHEGEIRKLSTLLEASQALLKERGLQAGLQRVLEILGRHHGAIRSTVVLLNEDTQNLGLEAAAGAIDRGRGVRFRKGEGITGQVLQSGKPIVVPQVSREPAFLNRISDRPELARGELTYISVPISLDNHTVGALASTCASSPTATISAW
jgi:Nif-specific regulatory protein